MLGYVIILEDFTALGCVSKVNGGNSGRGGNSRHGALHQPGNYSLCKKHEEDLLALW